MIGRARYLVGVAVLAAATAAAQTPPPKPPTPAELDRLAVEVLKDVHNRGAELYNRGDPAGCYRLYEGSLLTVRPFLAHRPAVQKLIDAGLTEVAGKAADGPKVQAFRLHEVIEQVRGELKKADVPKEEVAVPKAAEPPTTPKPADAPRSRVSGMVTVDGQPLAEGEVTLARLIALGGQARRTFTAKVTDGTFAIDEAVPPGRYLLTVTGKGVPDRFQAPGTSALRAEVPADGKPLNLDLNLR